MSFGEVCIRILRELKIIAIKEGSGDSLLQTVHFLGEIFSALQIISDES